MSLQWKIGDCVELPLSGDSGMVVLTEGGFAIAVAPGRFVLLWGHPEGYCFGALEPRNEDSSFTTLDAARWALAMATGCGV